jgi:hypothetical protein
LPIETIIAGCPLYRAFPIRAGNLRAMKISEVLPYSSEENGQKTEAAS